MQVQPYPMFDGGWEESVAEAEAARLFPALSDGGHADAAGQAFSRRASAWSPIASAFPGWSTEKPH